MRAWPRPVPAAISATLPPTLGEPGWRTRNLSGASVRTPWAAASRSLMSLTGAPAAAPICRSSTTQGRFVATQRPSITGPATPMHPPSTLIRGAPSRKASTALSRLSSSRLGRVVSRTIVIAAVSKTARSVLVPPTSPARIMAPPGLLPALLEQLGHEPRPAGLMAGAYAGPIVAVEVLVEEDEVAPVRIPVENLRPAVDRATAVLARQEEVREPPRQLGRHLPEVDLVVRAGGTRDLEIVAEEMVEFLERLDEEKVHGKPHRPAPVRIAAEHARRGLRGLVVDAVLLAVDLQDVGMVPVVAGERADAVVREELVFVQHVPEHSRELVARHDRQHEAPPAARLVDEGEVLAELGIVLDEPSGPAPEARQVFRSLRVPRLNGE